MAFNDIEKQKIKKLVGGYCSRWTPENRKDQLRYDYEIEKQNVIIFEIRPVWNNPNEITKSPFAKFAYVKSQKIWRLYWQRANGKWLRYESSAQIEQLENLIHEIDVDTYGCFFG
jgi:hypothetical protein